MAVTLGIELQYSVWMVGVWLRVTGGIWDIAGISHKDVIRIAINVLGDMVGIRYITG